MRLKHRVVQAGIRGWDSPTVSSSEGWNRVVSFEVSDSDNVKITVKDTSVWVELGNLKSAVSELGEAPAYTCGKCGTEYEPQDIAFCPQHGLCKANCCVHARCDHKGIGLPGCTICDPRTYTEA